MKVNLPMLVLIDNIGAIKMLDLKTNKCRTKHVKKLGHACEATTRSTIFFGMNVKGNFAACTKCGIAKAQQTKLSEIAEKREYKKGEKWSFDLSTLKSDMGNSKHWLIFVDWATRYQRSYFLKFKSDLSEKGLLFV